MNLNLLQDPPIGLNMPTINISFPKTEELSSVQQLEITINWEADKEKWCTQFDFYNDYGQHTFWTYHEDLPEALESASDRLEELKNFDSTRD